MKSFKWKNINIGVKFGMVLLVTVILFMVSIGIIFKSLIDIENNIKTLESRANNALDITRLETIIKSKDTLVSDYVHFQEEDVIRKFNEEDKLFKELITQIEPLMDNDDLKIAFKMVNSNNEDINNLFINEIVPLIKQDRKGEAIVLRKRASLLGVTTTVYLDKMNEGITEKRNQAINRSNANMDNVERTLILSAVISLLLGALIVVLVSKNVSSNLKKVVNMNNKISEGDLSITQMNYDGKDEIGQLAKATNTMVSNLQNMIKEISSVAKETNVQSKSLTEVSDEIRGGAEQIAATMEEMAAGVEEQANSSHNISDSINLLDNLIKAASNNVDILKDSSDMVLDITENGNKQMNLSINQMVTVNDIVKTSVDKVKGLDKKSEDISRLVQVIDEIAGQTNLLALNAAIEAARAGEAGKGFSVVAEEIRKLAEMVGDSLAQITEIVNGIQKESKEMTKSLEKGYKEVKEGTTQIKNTGETFEKINSEVIDMSKKIQSISSSLTQITSNSSEISKGGEQIATIAQENSAGIEETAASMAQQSNSIDIISKNSKYLENLAVKLDSLVSKFKL